MFSISRAYVLAIPILCQDGYAIMKTMGLARSMDVLFIKILAGTATAIWNVEEELGTAEAP